VGIWLFLIFVGLPIVEIALFVIVGGAIGVLWTLTLVILAAVIGLSVVRMQGMNALARLQESVDRGVDPVGPIADGALKVVAGLLLVVPGFFTDVLGLLLLLLLLLPPVRHALIRRGAARVTVRAATYARTRRPAGPAKPVETIDADYEIVGDDLRPPPGGSGWTRPQQ
jgi:UPF0716 protein FxsA